MISGKQNIQPSTGIAHLFLLVPGYVPYPARGEEVIAGGGGESSWYVCGARADLRRGEIDLPCLSAGLGGEGVGVGLGMGLGMYWW